MLYTTQMAYRRVLYAFRWKWPIGLGICAYFGKTWKVYSSPTTTNMGECILLQQQLTWGNVFCYACCRVECHIAGKGEWAVKNQQRPEDSWTIQGLYLKCPFPPLCRLRVILSHHNLQSTRASSRTHHTCTYMAACGCCSDPAILREIPTMWDFS